MVSRYLAYFRGLGARRRIDGEAEEELAFHLEQEIAANVARGLPRAEARRVALATLGGVPQTREAVRDVRATWVDALWRDVRHGARSLRAAPSFTIVALGVLTLSIGSATAIYSVVDGVVLRGLPFPDADRLVAVGERNIRDASDESMVAPQNFTDWRAQQTVFTGLAAIGYASVSLRPEGTQEPEVLKAQAVTADFFSVLGVQPLVGRAFTAENEVEGRARVAVISHGLWQRRYGGAPDVIGRRLPASLVDLDIVGVMPPGFEYPVGEPKPTDVWLPNVFRPEDRVRRNEYSYRLRVIGRLRDGVSIAGAQAEMDRITARLAAETPHWFEDRVASVAPLRHDLTRGVRSWMLMLLAAVGGVLLIACVNLANLMLVRVSARSRELAVRAALGASRADLVRGLLVESLMLSIAGAALGAWAAWFGVELLRAAIPAEVPRIASIAVNWRVLAATAAAAVATGLIFGTAPILQFPRQFAGSPAPLGMRAETPNLAHQWMRGALVALEVALAVILLAGSGLFLASFARVTSVDLGIDTRQVLTVRVRPLVGAHNWERAQQRNRGLLRDLVDHVRAIPGIEIAALVNGGVPLRGDLRTIRFGIPGRDLPRGQDLDFNEISADYFRVMRVPLIQGRTFTDEDRHGSEPVAIINEAAARKFFPEGDALGRTVDFAGLRRVVGIVGSIRHDGPETDWRRQGFIPIDQSEAVGATLMLRLSRDPGQVLPAVKSAIWSRFPATPLPDIQTLSQYFDQLVAKRRFNMRLLGLFGVLAIAIACVGIYGVMAYVVHLRTQEIGVRMALGARPRAILRSVLGRAATYLTVGLAIGLPGAWALSALVSGFLFEVHPHDPRVYAAVTATLALAGLSAAFVPAWRASRVDPLRALRLE